ncbi:MAG: hypothetical protein LBQ12_09105 [Deltaproteobacteria bacterium]|jgi:hypothetical protein|nr:hypothetical protein [Deltaproteobacteria bacterium]
MDREFVSPGELAEWFNLDDTGWDAGSAALRWGSVSRWLREAGMEADANRADGLSGTMEEKVFGYIRMFAPECSATFRGVPLELESFEALSRKRDTLSADESAMLDAILHGELYKFPDIARELASPLDAAVEKILSQQRRLSKETLECALSAFRNPGDFIWFPFEERAGLKALEFSLNFKGAILTRAEFNKTVPPEFRAAVLKTLERLYSRPDITSDYRCAVESVRHDIEVILNDLVQRREYWQSEAGRAESEAERLKAEAGSAQAGYAQWPAADVKRRPEWEIEAERREERIAEDQEKWIAKDVREWEEKREAQKLEEALWRPGAVKYARAFRETARLFIERRGRHGNGAGRRLPVYLLLQKFYSEGRSPQRTFFRVAETITRRLLENPAGAGITPYFSVITFSSMENGSRCILPLTELDPELNPNFSLMDSASHTGFMATLGNALRTIADVASRHLYADGEPAHRPLVFVGIHEYPGVWNEIVWDENFWDNMEFNALMDRFYGGQELSSNRELEMTLDFGRKYFHRSVPWGAAGALITHEVLKWAEKPRFYARRLGFNKKNVEIYDDDCRLQDLVDRLLGKII